MITAFVGKGGVGKTTISSAFALKLSRLGKTAIVSSDFMSSLRHIFPENPENLEVVELGEKDVAQRWKDRYGEEVGVVLKQFFDVDDWIIDHIANSPGVAEEFMISGIVDMELSGKYDFVVWDTAASSSTMHLLMLEKEFYEHLDRDVRIFLKLRDRFRSHKILELLEEWKTLANKVWNELKETTFMLVTTSDELSLIQATEIRKDFSGMGLKVSGEICNRCADKVQGRYVAYIPELRGSAREIVDRISEVLPENLFNLAGENQKRK